MPRASRDLFLGCDSSAEAPEATCRIYLQGCWHVDARTVTLFDTEHFMWEGLHTLRRGAKASGLAESHVNKMLQAAFDQFHDAAKDIYRTLCRNTPPRSSAANGSRRRRGRILVERPAECGVVISCVDRPVVEDPQTVAFTKEEPKNTPAPKDLFVACEEDRPVPVIVRFRKQKPLLIPDRDVLESFKP